jgi:hypothetical protein
MDALPVAHSPGRAKERRMVRRGCRDAPTFTAASLELVGVASDEYGIKPTLFFKRPKQ